MESTPPAPRIIGIHSDTLPPEFDLSKSQILNDIKGISDNLKAMRLMGVKNTKKQKSYTCTDKEALKLLQI